jgi:hypothetical protein
MHNLFRLSFQVLAPFHVLHVTRITFKLTAEYDVVYAQESAS